jgi:predicted nucleic acid-binding Zn ribbon protein
MKMYSNKRKRESNSGTLGEAIDAMLKKSGLAEGVNQIKIATLWDNQMGPMIARNTTDLSLRNGVVTIKIASSTLAYELNMGRDKIVRNLNEALQEKVVHSVVIRHGV